MSKHIYVWHIRAKCSRGPERLQYSGSAAHVSGRLTSVLVVMAIKQRGPDDLAKHLPRDGFRAGHAGRDSALRVCRDPFPRRLFPADQAAEVSPQIPVDRDRAAPFRRPDADARGSVVVGGDGHLFSGHMATMVAINSI